MNYVYVFLMLLPPKPGTPVYVERFPSAVSCQMRVIELRDLEPGKAYECRTLKSHFNLDSLPKAKKA